MTLQLVRKPPIGNSRTERLKITLIGNHTMKQKACMLLQAKYFLQHEHGLRFAGPTDIYMPLIDEAGHPLTHFADGRLIVDFNMLVESPYHCAADAYRI